MKMSPIRGSARRILQFFVFLITYIVILTWNAIAIPFGLIFAILKRFGLKANAFLIYLVIIPTFVFYEYNELASLEWTLWATSAGKWVSSNLAGVVIPAVLLLVTSIYTVYTKRLADLQRDAMRQMSDQALLPFAPRILLRLCEFRLGSGPIDLTLAV